MLMSQCTVAEPVEHDPAIVVALPFIMPSGSFRAENDVGGVEARVQSQM